MTSSENRGKSNPDAEVILAEFDAKEEMLTAFCLRTKNLIEASLEDAGIRYHSVQKRVKERKKLAEKYRDPAKNYRSLDDITDLAGIRVITYYEDDMDRVAEVIKREFHIDPENSVDKRDIEPDRFGYSALNYVCAHLERRTSDVEYKKFSGVRCEIQITSVLRHAWSEIEHEWYDLKSAYPNSIKRRFYRLAALLELAESEFMDLRRSKTQYERSVAVQVEAKVPNLSVDTVSLRSFIEQEPLVAEIDESIAAVFQVSIAEDLPDAAVEIRSKAANLAGILKLQDVRDSLEKYKIAIPEFVRRCQELWKSSRGRQLYKGVSVFHLSMLLVSACGLDAVSEYMKALNVIPNWEITRQVTIAQDVLAEYAR